MRLPLPFDYQMAMQAPSVAFLDETLRHGSPRRNQLGLPASVSGGFALTFDVTVGRTRYAVRCFHKQGNQLQQRYAAVADFVHTARLDFLVDVNYVHSGIRIGADILPIVRMPWVDGARLDDWIDDHLDRPSALNRVRRNIAAAATALRLHDAAHGDLQHGNILVLPDESIRLVDYDGMYLPALRHYGAAEQGHRNYQHPERAAQYEPSLDLFASHVIDLSLAALAHEPQLWKELNKNSGEGLLFSAEDFADPAGSPVFARLVQISELAEQVRRLRRACEVEFNVVPAALAGAATQAATRHRSGAERAWSAPVVIRAADRETLLAHQGDEATVVGRIVATNTIQRAGTITFLNFGNYRRGAFTVVAWERAHRDLVRTIGDPANLAGTWVCVTGLLSVYQKSGTITPQIELRNARSIRTVTALQAAAMLSNTPPRTQPPRPNTATTTSHIPPPTTPSATPYRPPPQSTTGSRSADLDDRLGKLYSSPTFSARLNNTGSTSATPRRPQTPNPTTGTPPRPSTPPPSSRPNRPPTQSPHPPVSSPSSQPPRRPAPQHVPTQPYYTNPPPTRTPPSQQWPQATTTPAVDATGLGVAALILALILGPIGLVIAVVALQRRPRRDDTDRVCAWIGLAIGSSWTLLCGCSLLSNLFTHTGTQ